MISRAAANLYWLHRYMERFEDVARLLYTTSSMMLDVTEVNRWGSVLIVSGELPTFEDHFGVYSDEADADVREFLTWDERSGISLRRSLAMARENARTTREAISREVWEVVNSAWLWLQSDAARAEYEEDALGFYRHARSIGHEFHGATVGTMMRDEPLHFMELGMYLECANQTARALDVKHHLLGESEGDRESVSETVAWISTLLTCSGMENYFKLYHRGVNGRSVAEFALLNSYRRSLKRGWFDVVWPPVEFAATFDLLRFIHQLTTSTDQRLV